jgi:hypothetical protein
MQHRGPSPHPPREARVTTGDVSSSRCLEFTSNNSSFPCTRILGRVARPAAHYYTSAVVGTSTLATCVLALSGRLCRRRDDSRYMTPRETLLFGIRTCATGRLDVGTFGTKTYLPTRNTTHETQISVHVWTVAPARPRVASKQ